MKITLEMMQLIEKHFNCGNDAICFDDETNKFYVTFNVIEFVLTFDYHALFNDKLKITSCDIYLHLHDFGANECIEIMNECNKLMSQFNLQNVYVFILCRDDENITTAIDDNICECDNFVFDKTFIYPSLD